MVERMKGEQARAAEENQRLAASSTRCAPGWRRATRSSNELSALKEERDVIRARVGEMLDQLEALNL